MNTYQTLHLSLGEHLRLEKKWAAAIITNGNAEIYAIDADTHERIFLVALKSGNMFFSSINDFSLTELSIYALTDTTVELYTSEEIQSLCINKSDEIKAGMTGWFNNLLTLPWLRFFAVRHDDYIAQWRKDDFLKNIAPEQLWETFLQHQEIFSLLLSGQFISQQKYFVTRLQKRAQKKDKLLEASINILLGDDNLDLWLNSSQSGNNGNIIYIVRKVAEFFHMDTSVINMPANIIKQLPEIDLLKRLVFKGGMQLRKVTLTNDWYTKDSGIFFLSFNNKWAAAIPYEPGKYKLYTEDNPLGIFITDEEASNIDTTAFICYAGLPARKLTVKDLLKFIYQQCWPSDYKYILFASFIAGLIPLIMPLITETIFSDIIPIGDRQALATVTQVMMVSGFTCASVSLVRSIAVLRISSHIDIAAEAALWSRLLSLPTTFFKKYQTGELVQRMQGIDAVKNLLTGDFVSSIFNTVFSFWSILLMCYYSLKLTGIAILVWLVYFIITSVIYRQVFIYRKNAISATNKTSAQVLEIFNGLAKFRCQGAESQAFYLWSKCFGEQWKWNLKLRWLDNYSSIINAVQPLILTLLLYYAAINWIKDSNSATSTMTYAQFIGFQSAFSAFNSTLVNMIPLAVNFLSVRPHIENLRPILEAVPETAEDKIEADRLSGEIEISHLSFSYSEDGPMILKDLNLHVEPGETIAIVGRSGCGKSTLMRLLLGFEQPNQGAIYYDGMDLNELSLTSVRSQMGVVLQNGQLMAGDIFHNIIGTTALSMKDAWIAAERVGLAKDIKEMPMQMYTAISEGSSNISGGQRQRILLARSIVNNPRILILDEATSALDNTTQSIVAHSLEEMSCTRIIVAHRLSTIRNADRILVMDEGKIVEEGTFDHLIAQNGIFTQLAQRQLA